MIFLLSAKNNSEKLIILQNQLGSELYQLVDLIYAYESKKCNSYFNEVDAASDDLT
mgnify:CR=1 FL=1